MLPTSHLLTKQKPKSDQRISGKEHDQSRIERIMRFVREYNAEIVAISTAVMGLFTVALFVATWLLYWGAEKHSERELRAYVFPTEVEARDFGIGRRLASLVRIRNSGQTPAYELRCVVRTAAGQFTEAEFSLLVSDPSPSTSFLGPGDTNWFPARADQALSEKLHNDIVNGIEAIYIFGEIHYVDAFKKKRFTKFRSLARGRNGTMLTAPDRPDVLRFAHDQVGNEAT